MARKWLCVSEAFLETAEMPPFLVGFPDSQSSMSINQPKRAVLWYGCALTDRTDCDNCHRLELIPSVKIKQSREAAQEYSPRRKPWDSERRNGELRRSERNLSHTAGNLILHLIFSTKGRRPLITPELRFDLFAYLGGIVREMLGTALIINGTADHVHMLIRIRPIQAAAEIARVVKTNSSLWVHKKWNKDFAWQTGYGVFSVSQSNVPAVSRYIAEQE